MRTKDWLVVAGIVLCTVALVACGGSDSDSSTQASGEEERGVVFAECMREHGVDMPDPQPGEGNKITIGGPDSTIDPSDPATQEALEACEGNLDQGGPQVSSEGEEETQEQAIAYAQCMREHGVNMADPQVEGNKIQMKVEKGGVDPNSPAYEEAEEACQDDMPNPPKNR